MPTPQELALHIHTTLQQSTPQDPLELDCLLEDIKTLYKLLKNSEQAPVVITEKATVPQTIAHPITREQPPVEDNDNALPESENNPPAIHVELPISSSSSVKMGTDTVIQPTEEKPLSAPPSKHHPKDIRNKIGINDNYLFVNELFRNDRKMYENALDDINACPNWTVAHNYIKFNLINRLQWNDDDKTVQTLIELVKTHFSIK